MEKTDFKKTDRDLYSGKPGRFDLVTVPRLPFLMLDGTQGPYGGAFAQAVAALYVVSYQAKFLSKRFCGRDFVVAPLEALWWAQDMGAFLARDYEAWNWTAMIRQPDWLTEEELARASAEAKRKQGRKKEPRATAAALDRVRFEGFDEGLSVQTLFVGPYDEEGPVLAEMHGGFIAQEGLVMRGKHHEIYLSDPRRVAARRLKTILRQPVRRDV